MESKTGGHRPVVLVVDDESVIADTLAEILTRSGYKGVAQYDGDSALETALLTSAGDVDYGRGFAGHDGH